MRQVYRTVAILVAAEVVVQAMAIAYFVAGLNRWMVSEGRVGVAHPWAVQSSDDAFNGFSPGVLDKLMLRSAEQWLDTGVGLTIHRIAATTVAPALALLLLLVALASKRAVAWASAIFAAVALRALLDLAAPVTPALDAASEAAGFAVFAAALAVAGPLAPGGPGGIEPAGPRRDGSKRAYGILAILVAVGVVVKAAALTYFLSGIYRYLTTGRGGQVWTELLYSQPWPEGIGLSTNLVTEFLVLPGLAVALFVVAFTTRVRRAVIWAAAVLGAVVIEALLSIVGEERPAVAAGYELATYAAFALALAAAWWMSRRGEADRAA